MRKYRILLLSSFFACLSSSMFAQMVGPDAYIKATSLEIGLDGVGGFEGANTTVSPPLPGMHYRSGTQFFGFVANPQVNAWLTFDGDFFTPGTPENGWGFQIGTGGPSFNNNCASPVNVPGSIVNWSHFFDCYSATWEGDATSGTDLHWRINYLAQENDLYYTTTVSVTNNTTATIPELYFHRNLDPDNNQPISGDFTTQNTIVSQPGTGCNLAHVKATSSLPSSQPTSYLGLAGVGSNFRVTVGGFSNRNASDIWNGIPGFTQTVGYTSFMDEAISLAYKITNLDPGETETFKFVIILDDAAATNAINNLLYFSYPGSATAPPPACTPYIDTVRTCGGPVPISVSGTVISDFTWNWSPGTGLSSTTGSTVTANPMSTTTYTVVGTPLNPCYQPVTMSVVVLVTGSPGPNPVIQPVSPMCSNVPPFNLVVDSVGGVWSGPGITDGTAGTFSPASAGVGVHTISYTAANTCLTTVTIDIEVLATPDPTITPPPTACETDGPFNLSAASSGGTWTGTGITSGSAGTFDPSVSGPGVFEVYYNQSGACPSADTVSVTIGSVTVPVTGFTYASPICKADPVAPVPVPITGQTPGGTYSSTPAGLSINSTTGQVNLAASTAGTYTIVYFIPGTVCGPAGTSTATLEIEPEIIPVTSFSYPSVCFNSDSSVPVLPAGFTPGGTFTSSEITVDDSTGIVTTTGVAAGSYNVTYTVLPDLVNCRAGGTSTANVVINPLPTIGTGPDHTMWIGDYTTIYAAGGVNYVWTPTLIDSCVNFSCDSIVVSPDETTEYCVTVTDNNGCIDSTCLKVNIEIPCPSNRNLTVPNAFTPNGDGNNDELCLYGWDDCVTDFQIVIYDRWGEKVFESKEANFCWDGKYKGKILDPAVFVYYIKGSYYKAGETINDPQTLFDIKRTGNISLVR
jgi:gliding motility-associated-like protein